MKDETRRNFNSIEETFINNNMMNTKNNNNEIIPNQINNLISNIKNNSNDINNLQTNNNQTFQKLQTIQMFKMSF